MKSIHSSVILSVLSGECVKKWRIFLYVMFTSVLVFVFQNFTSSSLSIEIDSHDMLKDYGIRGDGRSNDYSALGLMFGDINKNTYKGKDLGSKKVVLNFGTGKTYCAYFDAKQFHGVAKSGPCTYTGKSLDGEAREAILPLSRGSVELKLGSRTTLDAAIVASGSLTVPNGYIGSLFADNLERCRGKI